MSGINYARLRDFDLKILMGYEISPTCFYLTKRGLIQKPNKSELTTELKSMITKIFSTHLLPIYHHRNVIIDFMTYQKSVNKKAKPKNIQRFFISLWSTFRFLFKSCNQVDIVFDVYKENSIKASERRRRTAGEGIERIISGFDQPLPWKLIVSGLHQRISSTTQSGYLTRLKVNNLINCCS